jgi:hypothetical protein
MIFTKRSLIGRTPIGQGRSDIQRQVATAWVLQAEGKLGEALQIIAAAAAAEDTTEKHPVTPGPIAPAREQYANLLLEHGKAKEALAEFQSSSRRSLTGCSPTSKAGDKTTTQRYYARVVELAAVADTVRPEVAEARTLIAK